jgi:hypothetical protein
MEEGLSTLITGSISIRQEYLDRFRTGRNTLQQSIYPTIKPLIHRVLGVAFEPKIPSRLRVHFMLSHQVEAFTHVWL